MGLVNRAVRNVWRKKTRTLLVIIALGFSIAAIISVYSGVEASKTNTQKMIDDYELHIIETGELNELQELMIQVSNFGAFGGRRRPGMMPGDMWQTQTSNITSDAIINISSMDYVKDVIPLIERNVGEINFEEMREQMEKLREEMGEDGFPGGPGREPGDFRRGGFNDRQDIMISLFDYIIMGVPVDSLLDENYLILPSNIVDGRKITENDDSMVMIREELTFSDGFFAGAQVGDTINVEGFNFTIAGIYSSDTNRNYVYMDISDAQKVLGLEEGQALTLNVYVEDKSVVDMVAYEIQEMYEDYNVIAYSDLNSLFSDERQRQQDAEINSLESDSTKIQNTGNTIIIFLIITVALIVLFLMMYTVKERTKEIGLMKAIGFKGKNIMSQLILEGIAIGIIGGVIGIIIGVIFGPTISKALLPNSDVFATMTPSYIIILLFLGLTIFLAVVGTIYPAWQASRKSPMEAMRNE